jgi:CMP-N-acetylneuraminic acid synthetase
MKKVTIFLPCRSGSERVPNKNTKTFAGIDGGLLKIKLNQLIKVKNIGKVIVSTDDEKVKEAVFGYNKKIEIDDRPKELALSSTSTDDLIKYIPNIISEGHVLWTHVTSPFLNENIYELAINTYFKNLREGSFDSLMTVNRIQSFLWDEEGSFNYERSVEKWPRTQTLKELFEINSGIFINSIENYKLLDDRIGKNPYLMHTKGYSSFDIDWPDDFMLGEMIYKKLNS